MAGRAVLVAVLAALSGACKDKQPSAPAPAPATVTPAAADAAVGSATERTPPPATPAGEPLGEPLAIEEAAKVIPTLDGGKEILPLRHTRDKRQVHATWCLDGDSADEVARSVGRQMAAAGYTNLSIRGDARKAGVQGTRDQYQLSMVVSASTASTCPAPKHYFASATVFRLPG